MSKDIFSTWTQMGQTSFEALKKLGEINIKISEKLLKEQIALTESIMEVNSKNFDSFSKVKDPKDVLAKQSVVAEECSKKMVKSYSSCTEILEEAKEAYSELFEDGMEAANKTVKTAKGKVA